MKRPLFVIVMLLIISIGLVFMMKFPQQKSDDVQHQENPLSGDSEVMQSGDNQELTGNTITTGDENPLVYTNTEFGFQLTLPEGWEDYRAFVYHNNIDDIISISITLPAQESNRPGIPDPNKPPLDNYNNHIKGYANMFIIGIWTPEQYKKEYDRCFSNPDPSCMSIINLLGNNKDYYFTSIGLGDMPTDLYARRGDGTDNKYILIFEPLE